jgi:hypothetical protein
MGSIKTISIIVAANIKGLEVGLGKANKSLAKFASGAARMGSLLSFGVTAPLTALGKSAFDTFSKFENGMMKVNTVTGATVDEFKMLTDEAKRLGATTQFTALQVADLQLVLGRKGFDPTAIKNMEKSILDLALATGEDLSLAAETVATSINAFQLESSDAASVANTLASAAANSSIQLSTFSTAFGHAGASANAVGVDLEELSAMMGVLMDNGIKASKAGTGLRKVFGKLHQEGRSFTEVLDLATQGSVGLRKAQKLVGVTAANQLLILAKNKDKIAELTEEYKTNTTRLDEMATAMGSTSHAKIKKMESAIEGMKIEMGALIADAILPLIQNITDLASRFALLDDSTKRWIIIGGIIAASIGPILMILSLLATAVAVITGPVVGAVLAISAGIYAVIYVIDIWAKRFASVVQFIADNITALKDRFKNFAARIKNFLIKAFVSAIKFLDKFAQKVGITWFAMGEEPMLATIIPDEELTKFGKWSDSVDKATKKVDNLKDSIKDYLKSLMSGVFTLPSGTSKKEETEYISVDNSLDEIQALEDELDEEEIEIKVPFKFPSMQEIKNKVSDISSVIGDFAEQWGSQITKAFDVIGQALDNQMVKIENNHKREAALIEASSMTDKAKSEAMIALEEKTAKEKAKIQRKQAIAQKAAAIIAATINGAQAITKVAGQTGLGAIAAAPLMAALVGAQIAMIAASPIPQFAEGGIVSGPTMGLMGEYSGARSNPEVIAPLDKLKSIIGDSGGTSTVIPDVRITGDDLLIVFDRANRRKNRR